MAEMVSVAGTAELRLRLGLIIPSQFPEDAAVAVAPMLDTLWVVSVILVVTWVPTPPKLTGFGFATKVLLPPPPPPVPEPLNVTVIVTAATPLGAVGVRVTVADAPGFTPDTTGTLKVNVEGVIMLPLGAESQFGLVDPEVSPE